MDDFSLLFYIHWEFMGSRRYFYEKYSLKWYIFFTKCWKVPDLHTNKLYNSVDYIIRSTPVTDVFPSENGQ